MATTRRASIKTKQIWPCFACGKAPHIMSYPDSGFDAGCRECCTRTPLRNTMTKTINLWNKTYGRKPKKVKR